MLKVEEFIEVIKLDNLVDAYQDELDYPSFRDWSKQIVMVRKELAEKLIDDSYVINEMVKFIDDYIRQAVELGIVVLLEDIHKGFEVKTFKTKALSPEDYLVYDRIFNQEMAVFGVHNEPRLWGILGVGYGQGVDVGMGDLGIPSNETDWQLFRETAAYRQLAYSNLQHISNNLGHHIKGVVAAGVTEGVNPYEIARRLREIKIGPKIVKVKPKIVNGKVVRQGYKYTIPQKRYAEMIARTESSRAINQGRLDAYRRGEIKQVEFLSAGDNRVCSECLDYDGNKYPIDNAPLIPIHTACRCTYISSGKITDEGKSSVRQALEVSVGENLFRDSFTKDYKNNISLLKSDLSTFKNNYSELSSIQRKQFLRNVLNQYNQVGIIPKVAHSNLDNVGIMVLQSKKLEMLQARQKVFLKLGVGEKKSLMFIGTDKIKVLSSYLKPGIDDIYIKRLISYAKKKNYGGFSWSANNIINGFQKGKSINIIHLSKFKDSLIQFTKYNKLYLDGVKGHSLIHELGHTVYYNKNINNYQIYPNSWGNIWTMTEQMPTKYANESILEGFAECLASKYTGSYKLDSGVSNFLNQLEDRLLRQ